MTVNPLLRHTVRMKRRAVGRDRCPWCDYTVEGRIRGSADMAGLMLRHIETTHSRKTWKDFLQAIHEGGSQ